MMDEKRNHIQTVIVIIIVFFVTGFFVIAFNNMTIANQTGKQGCK